jgi:hypothetical protein
MLAPQVASFLIKKKEVAQAAMSRTDAISNIPVIAERCHQYI